MKDEYRRIVPGYVFGDAAASDQLLKRAAQAGCRWLIVSEVGGYPAKNERNVYFVSLMQTVYDVASGSIVKTGAFSSGTYSLTPLEAFIHVCKGMNYDWLFKR